MLNKVHTPVMLNEVIKYLSIKPGAKIIDTTLDGGGHTKGILERYPDVKILGIEWDCDLAAMAKRYFDISIFRKRIIVVNNSYVNLKKIVAEHDFHPDGIVFDLGLSSWHLEKSGRGFSFQKDEALDMRFNPKIQTLTAADIVNKSGIGELTGILSEYGEEQFAESIAKNILNQRKIGLILKTGRLVEIINNSVPGWYRKRRIHPATKTFQALRIAVNDELNNIKRGISAGIEVLDKNGRLVVISFHGLEDKLVREIFKEGVGKGEVRWVIKRTVKPSWQEIRQNPRARSAKMKIIEKI